MLLSQLNAHHLTVLSFIAEDRIGPTMLAAYIRSGLVCHIISPSTSLFTAPHLVCGISGFIQNTR